MCADRRSRLREFQLRLTERLEKAMASPVTPSKLGILINDSRWLVDLAEAEEIYPLQDIVTVPYTHDWYLGLTNARGSLVSIVDLSLFFGGSPTRTEHGSRILSFAPYRDLNVGIIVTRTLGLHNTAEWRTQDAKWIDAQDQIWTRISVESLMLDERFLNISRVRDLPVHTLS
jgi:twitching motility protein PilI